MAFKTIEVISTDTKDVKIALGILSSFVPIDTGLLAALSASDDANDYFKRIREIFRRIRTYSDVIDNDTRGLITLVDAAIAYHSRYYSEAETKINLFPDGVGSPETIESVFYLEMMTAEKMQRDPGVRALRANRYLSSYAKSRHYKEAIIVLINAYYEMGLYDAALETSKKVFVKEIVGIGQNNTVNTNVSWLTAVANIGRCYVNLNEFQSANQIFRTYENQLLSFPTGVDAYIDWITVATNLGQNFEAVRRFDRVLPNINDPNKRMEIRVARDVLALQIGVPDAYKNWRTMIASIHQDDDVDFEKKRKLLRDLYEAILEVAFADYTDDTDMVLVDVLTTFPDEEWSNFWLLKWLSGTLTDSNLRRILDRHQTLVGALESAVKDNRSVRTMELIDRHRELLNSLIEINGRVDNFVAQGLNK